MSQPAPRVSIILPCHNVAHFIDDALGSVVAQSAFADFEVIPVDDGSTDHTWEKIEEYQRRYPDNVAGVRLPTASGAPGRPRNVGLDHARGEYVIFMDPDDRAYGDGYSTLLRTIDEHRSDVVIGTRYAVPEREGPEAKLWVDFLVDAEYVNAGGYATKLDLLSQRPGILRSIYRRDLIERHGLRFLEGVTSSEDEIFDKKYLLLAERITKINDVVYLYTAQRPGSITTGVSLKLYQDLPTILAGMTDALSVYFAAPIVSFRIASLLRNFYYPKLLLLDGDLTDDALDLIRAACADYGFDRLLLTENAVDRTMLELLRDRRYSQLTLYFMNLRLARATRTVRNQNKVFAELDRTLVKTGWHAFNYARLAGRAIGERAPQRFLAANIGTLLAGRPNGYWLFMDRRDKAGDNGEALYRYVRDNRLHDRIAFVLRDDCPDWQRLRRDGFHLVAYNTVRHWRLLYNCAHFFGSHVDDVIITPWQEYTRRVRPPAYRLTFLQHGIIGSDLSSWLGAKRYHVFCSASRREYESLLANIGYRLTPDTLKLTGLARHDLLTRRTGDYILVAPTWRSFLVDATPEQFAASEFHHAWRDLIYHEKVGAALAEHGLHLKVALHPSLARFGHSFPSTERVQVLDYHDVTYSTLISGARMLVTDYSTVSFDALYLRRPVVFHTFAESGAHSTNKGRDFGLYRSLGHLAPTHDEAVDAIVASAAADFALDEERIAHIDGYFAYADDRNRERIIDAVLSKDRT